MGMRRSHYIGLAKTHLHHLATAAAFNLVRCLLVEHGYDPVYGARSLRRTVLKNARRYVGRVDFAQ